MNIEMTYGVSSPRSTPHPLSANVISLGIAPTEEFIGAEVLVPDMPRGCKMSFDNIELKVSLLTIFSTA